MADGTCMSCGDAVIWAPAATTGALIALNPQPLAHPAERLIALNPKTRLCRRLNRADLHMARTWAQHDVTFHAEHNCLKAA